MHELEFIKQFQIIQSKNTDIVINVIGNLDDAKELLLCDNIRNRLGNVAIKINVVDEIERDLLTGKIKTIIRK